MNSLNHPMTSRANFDITPIISNGKMIKSSEFSSSKNKKGLNVASKIFEGPRKKVRVCWLFTIYRFYDDLYFLCSSSLTLVYFVIIYLKIQKMESLV